MLVEFVNLNTVQHLPFLLELNTEYLEWIGNEVKSKYKVDMNSIIGPVHSYSSRILDELELYQAPDGAFYLLKVKGSFVGMGAIRKINSEIGELKRMYIKPDYRGKGYGKMMLAKLIKRGEELGYTTLRLDTGPFMESAQHLYRSVGFVEIERYPEAESPEIEGVWWVCMEKNL